jgi:hypothetical protein
MQKAEQWPYFHTHDETTQKMTTRRAGRRPSDEREPDDSLRSLAMHYSASLKMRCTLIVASVGEWCRKLHCDSCIGKRYALHPFPAYRYKR